MTNPAIRQPDVSVNLYEQDYYHWLTQTALLLQRRDFDQLDLAHLIDEIEDMGRSERRSLESNLRVVLTHLLKWKYQPQQRSGSWRGSIAEHRIRIRKILKDSPSLSNHLVEVLAEAYQDAMMIAVQETGLDLETFPVECEWSLQSILDETWLPD